MLNSIYELKEAERLDLLHKYVELNYSVSSLASNYGIDRGSLERELEYEHSEGKARKQAYDDLVILDDAIEQLHLQARQGNLKAIALLPSLLECRHNLSAVKALMTSYYERDLIKAAMRIKP